MKMSRNHKILGAGAVAVALGLLGTTVAIRAQKPQPPSTPDRGPMSLMIDSNPTWLGVETEDVTSDQVRDLKLGDEYGAYVKSVEDDSPAAKAGLQSGDVIVEFAGEKVRSVAELRRLVGETPTGRKVAIRVRRNGEEKTLNATVEARNNESAEPLMGKLRDEIWPRINVPVYDFSFDFGGPRLGVSVDRLTPQLGEYFGVKDGKGVLVQEINPGSAAEKAGLKAGDCITKLDSTPIESANELHRALLRKQGESREGRDVMLTIVRDRKEQTLKVHLEPVRQPGREASDSGMADLIDAQQLAAQARDLAANSEVWRQQTDELRNQLDSAGTDLEDQGAAARAGAEAARKQAQAMQKQWRDQQGHWQQQLKELQPQMKEFQQEMKDLKLSLGSDYI
jgi:serine protease Do